MFLGEAILKFYYLCLSRDLTEGQFKCFEVFDKKIIAKRENNEIVVADNVCLHRGFMPGEGSGSLPVTCPYHGKKFEFHRRYKAAEIGKFVFFGEEDNFPWDDEILPIIGQDLGQEFGSITQQVKSPFQLWMQGTADPMHVKSVHKDFKNLFKDCRPFNVDFGSYSSRYNLALQEEMPSRYNKYFFKRPHMLFRDTFFHMIIMPHLSITSFLGIFYSVETALPRNYGCEVETRFFVSKNVDMPSQILTLAMKANKKILVEDKEIIERWALSPRGVDEFMPGEERIKDYLNKLKQWDLS